MKKAQREMRTKRDGEEGPGAPSSGVVCSVGGVVVVVGGGVSAYRVVCTAGVVGVGVGVGGGGTGILAEVASRTVCNGRLSIEVAVVI